MPDPYDTSLAYDEDVWNRRHYDELTDADMDHLADVEWARAERQAESR